MTAPLARDWGRGEEGGRLGLRYTAIVVSAVSWGFWAPILRLADRWGAIPPTVKATVLVMVMTVVSGAVAQFDKSPPTKRTAADGAALLGLAFADAFNILLLFQAYKVTSVAVAALTHYLAPIFVAMAAPFVLREKAGPRTIVAIAISFAGLVLLLEPWAVGGAGEGRALGALCGAGSAVFYATNVLLNKHASKRFTASELAFYHSALAVPILAAFVPLSTWGECDPRGISVLAVGSLGPGAAAGLAFVWALRRVPASHASTLTLIEPLVAVLLGTFVLGEPMTAARAVGGVVILFGAWLLVHARVR